VSLLTHFDGKLTVGETCLIISARVFNGQHCESHQGEATMSGENSDKKERNSLEELWFHQHNQKLIEKLRLKKAAEESEKLGRPQLTLIQGGKSSTPADAAAPTAPAEKPAKKVA
jgi:hypothetical protein